MNEHNAIAGLAEDALDGDHEALADLKELADQGDVGAEMTAELIPDFVDFEEEQPEDKAFD